MKLIATLFVMSFATTALADDYALEEKSFALAQAQNKDAEQVGEFLRGRGGKNDFQVLLEASKCYWFSGAAIGLGKFYMYLWTPNSNMFTPRVADTKSMTGEATLAYCTKEAGMYKFQVKGDGGGNFVVGVFVKDAPKQAVKEAPPEMDLGAICDKTASVAAPPDAVRSGEFLSGSGDRVDYPVQMDGGKCYWIVACANPETVQSLYLYLWGPDNKRVTETKGDTPNPVIGHCAKATGMFKVQAKLNAGKGSYKLGVYKK
jgi:hypothetical protein